MKNILIINAHQPYPFSKGKLNQSLTELATTILRDKGHNIRSTHSANSYSVEEELEKHQWADCLILQSPVNWMGIPWSFKKYMDEIYTAGMSGELCRGDGRTAESPKKNYGAGGTLVGKKYLLSLTFNAPREAFEDKNEYLFGGKSVDDLFFPMHMNFRFFGMEPLPTFACFDVMKDPQVENDIGRYTAHLNGNFGQS